jgi:hypothetical protein
MGAGLVFSWFDHPNSEIVKDRLAVYEHRSGRRDDRPHWDERSRQRRRQSSAIQGAAASLVQAIAIHSGAICTPSPAMSGSM